MRRPLIALLLALSASLAVAAPPPSPAPMLAFQGRDQVLIGRIYWRESGQTQPLARFGLVLTGKSGEQSVPVSSASSGSVTVTFRARRDGDDAAQVSWSVLPGAGSRVPQASGRLTVKEGSIGHAALGMGGEGELFASLETGRASVFNLQRLWEHFGVMTDAQRFSQPQPAAAPISAWPAAQGSAPAFAPSSMPAAAPAPVAAAPQGGTFTVACGAGRRFDLSTGSGRGTCELELQGDRVVGGRCDDGEGNSARVSCALNGGDGSCVSSSGSGACRLR